MAPGYGNLIANDPSGTVVVWSKGLDHDTLLAVVRSLRRYEDGSPGWIVDEAGMGLTKIHSGWSSVTMASRELKWPEGEMWIVGGYPDVISIFPTYDSYVLSLVDVNGAVALASETEGQAALVWTAAPGLLVRIGLYGTLDEALAIARSVGEVDVTTWEAASVVDTSTDDGCNSMFC
jgi:hypothetical protein